MKLHLILSRLLSLLHTFPGCVLLVCHMDSPQNITLQKDFASKLFCFLRMGVPDQKIRAELWRRLLPPAAPLSASVNFIELGKRYELIPGEIRSAVARACAEAAMRGEEIVLQQSKDGCTDKDKGADKSAGMNEALKANRGVDETSTRPRSSSMTSETGVNTNNSVAVFAIRQKDLMLAGEAEVRKSRIGNYDLVSKLFL